jgi:hypothetical protein
MSDVAKASRLSFFITSESLILLIHLVTFLEKTNLTIMVITTKKQGKCKFDSYFGHKQNHFSTNNFIL